MMSLSAAEKKVYQHFYGGLLKEAIEHIGLDIELYKKSVVELCKDEQKRRQWIVRESDCKNLVLRQNMYPT
jgi:hypothetical protein